jgi:glycerol-3-phosphate cytidylyltransferase
VTRIVGYVPGAWDMFHIGHLNILKHARPHCDWLIVGVVTDETVRRVKNKEPMVPLADRIAIMTQIDLVDEVVVDDSTDKVQMWHRLHFDVLFKGDDWKGTAKGDQLEAGMASVGARVIYFPYTPYISSTEIRRRLTQTMDGLAATQSNSDENL